MEGAPEDIALAVEIIRQLENLAYPEESILKAMVHVCQDTLNKLPDDGTREYWRQTLLTELRPEPEAGVSRAH